MGLAFFSANTRVPRGDVGELAPHLDRALLAGYVARIKSVRTASYELWDHSLAVADHARRVAERLGLDDAGRQNVYLGGLLHDVGKSLSRSDVLFKVGALTSCELTHLRRHPTDGARLVRPLGVPDVTDAVRYHHELLDGTGYPSGLAGHAIPLGARIVGAVDYYEALCEDRAYRSGVSRKEGLRIVEEAAILGKLDPAVVQAIEAASSR